MLVTIINDINLLLAAFDDSMDDVNDALQQLTMRQQERNYYSSNVARAAPKSAENKHRSDRLGK